MLAKWPTPRIGLVVLEIKQRSLDLLARLLVGAGHMNRVAHRLHPLLEYEDFIFLCEFPCQHQYFLAAHARSSLSLNAGRQKRGPQVCERRMPSGPAYSKVAIRRS